MPIQAQIHFGNTPLFKTTFKVDGTAFDISAASTKQFWFQRPDGTTFKRSGTFSTDGVNGQLEYQSVSDDLNMIGSWLVQAYAAWSGGNNKHGLVHHFTVHSRAGDSQ